MPFWSDFFIHIFLKRPIGIFDSGVGGLTVAIALKEILPRESFIYFGDIQHVPYGDKSRKTIIGYSENATRFLSSQNCKIIVMACNTASAIAFQALTKKFPQTIILNIIDPVVKYVAASINGKVGIIATRATIRSNFYKNRLQELNSKLELVSATAPLLVPIIEKGFINTDISKRAILQYLGQSKFDKISALILGCTHYSLIEKEIKQYLEDKTKIINSPELVAKELRRILMRNKLLNSATKVEYKFYVSNKSPVFSQIARMFFGEEINLTEKRI